MNIKNRVSISKFLYQGILDRDNNECQFHCGRTINIIHNPLLHFFLDGDPKNKKAENIITLCKICISKLPRRKKING